MAAQAARVGCLVVQASSLHVMGSIRICSRNACTTIFAHVPGFTHRPLLTCSSSAAVTCWIVMLEVSISMASAGLISGATLRERSRPSRVMMACKTCSYWTSSPLARSSSQRRLARTSGEASR